MMQHVFISLLYLVLISHTFSLRPTVPSNTVKEDFDKAIFTGMDTFAQVIDLVQKKHYKPDNPAKAMLKSIDAFVSNLDPHSNLLDPETYTLMLEQTSGEFFGIGIVIDNTRKPKDKALTVVDILPDGPAERAGLQKGDKIVEVEGKGLEGMQTEKVIALLKGARSTKVAIKVMRDNAIDLLSFTLTRDIVKEQFSLCFFIKDYSIYYLSLTMFSETAAKQIEALLQKALVSPCRGIILDLRGNSGGLLTSVLDIAGLFLKKGSVVVTMQDKTGATVGTYRTERNPVTDGSFPPIIVLIDNYTASAAEILAGCLKIHSKNKEQHLTVFTLGETSFGKGSVQEVIPLSNNCALKLTTTIYVFVDGTTPQGTGLLPDFPIERTLPQTEQMRWLTKQYGREQTLPHFISLEKKGPTQEKPVSEKETKGRNAERIASLLQRDNQFAEGVSLLNSMALITNQTALGKDKELLIKELQQIFPNLATVVVEEIQ